MGVDSFQDSVHRTQSITLSFLSKKKKETKEKEKKEKKETHKVLLPLCFAALTLSLLCLLVSFLVMVMVYPSKVCARSKKKSYSPNMEIL